MFEQIFKNIDDILHKDAGCSSELDYVEQTSWLLFLKYLDDLENDKITAGELAGKSHKGIISKEEAKFIAQKYCLDDDYCSKNCVISSASVYDNEEWYPGKWRAGFDFKLTSSNFVLLAICRDNPIISIIKYLQDAQRAQ